MPLRYTLSLSFIACALVSIPTMTAQAEDNFDVGAARRSVVYVKSFIPNLGAGVGTGFLVDEAGLIFTNRHVIESGNRSHRESLILVGVASKDDPEKLQYFKASVVHVVNEPETRDFAILKIAAKPSYGKFQPLVLSKDTLGLGEDVSVMGFPFIQEGEPTISLTKGTVSSTKVRFGGVSFYQTDAAVNPGNSGGPFFNKRGEVAGIVTSRISGADNIGYALRLEEIAEAVEASRARAASIKPEQGPLDKVPDLEQLAESDSKAGSGTEARTPDWAKPKPFDVIGRMWTSADARFSVEATYVTSKDDKVSLRKTNGAIVDVPIARLCELDRYYIRAIESPWQREGRLPAPPAGVIKLKGEEIAALFKDDVRDGGRELFEKLLKLALDTRNQDPAATYVCLKEASRVAASEGQIALCFITLAGMERWYEIDDVLLTMQVDALSLAVKSARTRDERALALAFAFRLVDFAMERHDVESGEALLRIARSLVAKLRDSRALEISREVTGRFEEFKKALSLANTARTQLEADPEHSGANEDLGVFVSVFDGDWSEGLSYLSKAADANLANAAKLELANPTTPKSQLALAEAWWALAEEASGMVQEAYRAHAAEWYQRCFPMLSALDKTKVRQRIAVVVDGQAEPAPEAGASTVSQPPSRAEHVVELGPNASETLASARRGQAFLKDREYALVRLPRDLNGGSMVLRQAARISQWLPAGLVEAKQECHGYVALLHTINGQPKTGPSNLAEVMKEAGWEELSGFATTGPPQEHWEWKLFRRPVPKGPVTLPRPAGVRTNFVFFFN